MDEQAQQILESGQTTGAIFRPTCQFFLSIHGLQSPSQDWYLECLPQHLPDSSTQWTAMHRDAFSDANGRAIGEFFGSLRYKYRIRNYSGSPVNSGITAYWTPLNVGTLR